MDSQTLPGVVMHHTTPATEILDALLAASAVRVSWSDEPPTDAALAPAIYALIFTKDLDGEAVGQLWLKQMRTSCPAFRAWVDPGLTEDPPEVGRIGVRLQKPGQWAKTFWFKTT